MKSIREMLTYLAQKYPKTIKTSLDNVRLNSTSILRLNSVLNYIFLPLLFIFGAFSMVIAVLYIIEKPQESNQIEFFVSISVIFGVLPILVAAWAFFNAWGYSVYNYETKKLTFYHPLTHKSRFEISSKNKAELRITEIVRYNTLICYRYTLKQGKKTIMLTEFPKEITKEDLIFFEKAIYMILE